MPAPRSPGLSHAALLEHLEWIRRLAAALVADRELAEDLVGASAPSLVVLDPRF